MISVYHKYKSKKFQDNKVKLNLIKYKTSKSMKI